MSRHLSLGRQTHRLQENGVWVKTAKAETIFYWGSISRVGGTGGCIFATTTLTNQPTFLVIPKRAFQSAGEAAEFLKLAHDFREQARAAQAPELAPTRGRAFRRGMIWFLVLVAAVSVFFTLFPPHTAAR